MYRLFGFFICFALLLTFIVLNLDNKCDVNIGFHIFSGSDGQGVPIYITSFVSIFIGMILAVPLFSFLNKRKGNAPSSKAGKKNKSPIEYQDEIPGENGPYGIN